MLNKFNELLALILVSINTYLEKDYTLAETYYLIMTNYGLFEEMKIYNYKNELKKYKFYFNIDLVKNNIIESSYSLNQNQLQIRLYYEKKRMNNYKIIGFEELGNNHLLFDIDLDKYKGVEFFYISSPDCDSNFNENLELKIIKNNDNSYKVKNLLNSSEECNLINLIRKYDMSEQKDNYSFLDKINFKKMFIFFNHMINNILMIFFIFILYKKKLFSK